MNKQMKFDSKYYDEVRKYLDSHKDLHSNASFGGNGRIYLTGYKTTKGFILENCCDKKDQSVISTINDHPSFKQIKSDLQKIIEGKK